MPKINIIYLLPQLKGVSGGGKVIYNHSFILDKLNNNINSKILHIKKNFLYKLELSVAKRIKLNNKKFTGWEAKKMRVSNNFLPNKNWFNKKINLAKNLKFDSKSDFIILPEIFSHFAEELEFKKRNIKYAIFVQGSFHMNSNDNHNKIKASYENAEFILTTSVYSINFIKKIFPKCRKKILKINLSINISKPLKSLKKNYITCIPRKLPTHYFLLMFYLKNKLPNNWSIDPIENITEKELNNKIQRSKIFLSFSHFEGFGLPPLEAAIAGNKVIGYDGGGGQEYWQKPIFTKIEYGEIYKFGEKILDQIKSYNSKWLDKTKKHRNELTKKYSTKTEKEILNNLARKITALYR